MKDARKDEGEGKEKGSGRRCETLSASFFYLKPPSSQRASDYSPACLPDYLINTGWFTRDIALT